MPQNSIELHSERRPPKERTNVYTFTGHSTYSNGLHDYHHNEYDEWIHDVYLLNRGRE